VVTRLPSNLLLIAVPLMPSLSLAVMVLLLRFSASQMNVPTRQSYTTPQDVHGAWERHGGLHSINLPVVLTDNR